MPQHRTIEDALRYARRRAAQLGDRANDLAHDWSDELGARVRDVRAQLPNVRLPEFRRAPPPPPPPPPGPSAAAVAVPVLLIAAGAGLGWAAWRLWSQSQARARLDAEGGAAGKADPEQVMAHSPAPAEAPLETPDPSAEGLNAPAEEIMAHAPPEGGELAPARRTRAAPRAKSAPGVSPSELLSTAGRAGLVGETEPHLSATPEPTLSDAVKPSTPRRPKPPEAQA